MSTPTVSLKLDTDTKARLNALAETKKRSAHYLMREAIGEYLVREEARASFRADAMAAWETYQETGLHLNLVEADAWLTQLEAGQDVEPPECHR